MRAKLAARHDPAQMATSDANDPGEQGDVTRILHALRAGQPAASDELLKLVYADLRQIARGKMRSTSR